MAVVEISHLYMEFELAGQRVDISACLPAKSRWSAPHTRSAAVMGAAYAQCRDVHRTYLALGTWVGVDVIFRIQHLKWSCWCRTSKPVHGLAVRGSLEGIISGEEALGFAGARGEVLTFSWTELRARNSSIVERCTLRLGNKLGTAQPAPASQLTHAAQYTWIYYRWFSNVYTQITCGLLSQGSDVWKFDFCLCHHMNEGDCPR